MKFYENFVISAVSCVEFKTSNEWSPYLKKHIQALENVQRRATKLVPEIKALSYEQSQKLFQLSLPTLAYRRARGDMIETYKLFHRYDQEVVLI